MSREKYENNRGIKLKDGVEIKKCMDFLKSIFGEDKTKSSIKEDIADIPLIKFSEPKSFRSESEKSSLIEPIMVRKHELTQTSDLDEVIRTVERGDIILMDMSPLMEEDPKALKNATDRLKREIEELGGNIARVSDFYVLIVPSIVEIDFESRE